MGGKKKGGHNFGRALIKDRFGRGNKTLNADSFVSITHAIAIQLSIVNYLKQLIQFLFEIC